MMKASVATASVARASNRGRSGIAASNGAAACIALVVALWAHEFTRTMLASCRHSVDGAERQRYDTHAWSPRVLVQHTDVFNDPCHVTISIIYHVV
eukprot:3409159-Pleurochrysis_carterae.AAC.2